MKYSGNIGLKNNLPSDCYFGHIGLKNNLLAHASHLTWKGKEFQKQLLTLVKERTPEVLSGAKKIFLSSICKSVDHTLHEVSLHCSLYCCTFLLHSCTFVYITMTCFDAHIQTVMFSCLFLCTGQRQIRGSSLDKKGAACLVQTAAPMLQEALG